MSRQDRVALAIDRLAFDLTEVVASLDADPYGNPEAGADVLLPTRAAALLYDCHQRAHAIRRATSGHLQSAFATLEQIETQHIERVLAATGNNYARAAGILDIDKATLYRKRKRWGLDSQGASDA